MTEIEFTYTNWRGETAVRKARPLAFRFAATDWHPEPQLLLRALDTEKGAERDFAVRDMVLEAPVTLDDLRSMLFDSHLQMLRDHVLSHGISDEFVMALVSDDAKALAGGTFAHMTPGKGELRFGMKKSRPTARTQAALAELVAAGAVERRDGTGVQVAYVTGLNMEIFAGWLAANAHRDDIRFDVVEPVAETTAS